MDGQPAPGEAMCQRQPSEAVMTFPPHVPAPLNDAELVGELERLHQARVDTLASRLRHPLHGGEREWVSGR